MRLVSAIYNDGYPFDMMRTPEGVALITEFDFTNEPAELRSGDILVVWGGEDISPTLYSHGRSSESGAWPGGPSRRDRIEWDLMQGAIKKNIPIIGVCRGAQMLCAAAGGFLVQDVDSHGGYHEVHTFDGKKLWVNSLHHQMMVARKHDNIEEEIPHKLIAWTEPRVSKFNYMLDGVEVVSPEKTFVEAEFIHFTEINGFAIQWHPEMMDYPLKATDYVFDYIVNNIKIPVEV